MKKYKTLIIYYLITLVLSLISLLTYVSRSSDFCIAISSITSELSLIVSAIAIIYALLFCSSYMKDNKLSRKSIIISMLVLFATTIAIFISFINIFSHRSFIDYFIRMINGQESYDIVKLFIKFFAVYIYFYIFAIIGLLLYNYYNKDKKVEMILLAILLMVLTVIIINIRFEHIKTIIAIESVIYLLFLTMAKDKLT